MMAGLIYELLLVTAVTSSDCRHWNEALLALQHAMFMWSMDATYQPDTD